MSWRGHNQAGHAGYKSLLRLRTKVEFSTFELTFKLAGTKPALLKVSKLQLDKTYPEALKKERTFII